MPLTRRANTLAETRSMPRYGPGLAAGPGLLPGLLTPRRDNRTQSFSPGWPVPATLGEPATEIDLFTAHAADRVSAQIVAALAATSMTFPRKRLVQNFTSRFRGKPALLPPIVRPGVVMEVFTFGAARA